jgi:hypothetical protein
MEEDVPYKWKLLEKAVAYGPRPEREIQDCMSHYGDTREQAIARLEAYEATCQYWRNDLYQVQTRLFVCEQFGGRRMMHINIRRIDGAPVFDWRHRQLIKNQLLGEQCEAVELYPAEERLQDTSNKYHLWGFTDPTVRFPFGMEERDVVTEEVKGPAGVRQRSI